MERLLHITLAVALVLLTVLASCGSAAPLSSPIQGFNHIVKNNHQRSLQRKNVSGPSPISSISPFPSSSSSPSSSPISSTGLLSMLNNGHPLRGDDRRVTETTNLTDYQCPRCAIANIQISDSPSNPSIPSQPSTSSSSNSLSSSTRMAPPPSLTNENQILDEEAMRLLRLENFKEQILSKMHLTERPQVRRSQEGDDDLPSVIEKSIVPGMLSGLADLTETPSTPNTIILSTKSKRCRGRHNHRSSCFIFTLEGSLSEGVSKAILWLWKVEDSGDDTPQTFTVRQLEARQSHHHHHNHGKTQGTTTTTTATNHTITTIRAGWVEIDLTEMVSGWASQGRAEVKVEIICPSCRGRSSPISDVSQHRPFISVTRQEPKIRHRRTTRECSTSTEGGCCRASMEVTAAQMGWGDWIIEPRNFTFYYCRGHCLPSPASIRSNNTSRYMTLLQRLISQQPIGSAQRAALMPCCSPTRFSSMSFLARTNSIVKYHVIDDIVVESCGCNA